ncbi:hypothetical protein SLA2020_277400 [Shorea laevis]
MAGDFDQIGCNIYNAAKYNRNVIKKFTSKPPLGTPARPGWVLPSFIFSLVQRESETRSGYGASFRFVVPERVVGVRGRLVRRDARVGVQAVAGAD